MKRRGFLKRAALGAASGRGLFGAVRSKFRGGVVSCRGVPNLREWRREGV